MISADSAYVTIKEIFNTIQGEGSLSGTPSTFIRFAGCSVKDCFGGKCDTDWKNGRAISVTALIDSIKDTGPHNHFVVTGGEPLDQKFLLLFLVELTSTFRGASIQVETSSSRTLTDHYVKALTTYYSHCPDLVYRFEDRVPLFFTCSPKIHRKQFKEDLFTALTFFSMFRQGELKIVFDPSIMSLSEFAEALSDDRIERICYAHKIPRYIMIEEAYSQKIIADRTASTFFKMAYSYESLAKFKISPRLQNYFNIK
jgi:organic radical activating enzyme